MKTLTFSAAALLAGVLCAPSAWADLEMTQQMTNGEKTAQMVTRFKLNDKKELKWVRVDQPDGVSLITDFDKKQVVALHHEEKIAVIRKFRALRKKLPKDKGDRAAAAANGSEEKIDGQDTALYEGTLLSAAGEAKVTLWVAKAHPQAATVVPLVQAYAESPVIRATPGLSQSLKAMPGVVMKSAVEVGGHQVITTLVTLSENPLQQELFEIPEDFRKETP